MRVRTDVRDISPPPGELTCDAATLDERVATIHANAADVSAATLIALTDHTTLKSTDTPAHIEAHIDAALAGPLLPAAVCVTPDYAAMAVKRLAGTPIAVASVAGAFPHGRTLTEVIRHEITGVLEAGVTELDIVLDRAAFLTGATDHIHQQIAWVRQTCDDYTARDSQPRRIKLILETGELGSLNHIRDAAWLVLHAGADLVKTSTGTIPAGADPATVLLLCDVVAAFNRCYDTARGVKVSGGVSSAADARLYFALAYETFGEAANNPATLRFGASKLLAQLRDEVNS